MSKAFTKEDEEPPERSTRTRSSSGLPPGASNYVTAEGERQLRRELEELIAPRAGAPPVAATSRIAELQRVLSSAIVVPEPDTPSSEVLFGAMVTLRRESGELTRCRLVGVDETHLDREWVSWVTPVAKALIGRRVGERVRLDESGEVEIVKIEY